MKKFFMVAVMAVAALTANAQVEKGKINYTPYVGLGYSNLSNFKDKDGSSIGGGVTCGLGCDVQYNVSEKFGVSAGLAFQYAATGSAEYSRGNGGPSIKKEAKMSFLNIPILAHYYFTEHFGAKAGIKPGFLLSAKCDGETIDDTNSFQMAIPVGLSWKFNSPLELGLQCDIPLTKINSKGDDSENLLAVYATLGWRF